MKHYLEIITQSFGSINKYIAIKLKQPFSSFVKTKYNFQNQQKEIAGVEKTFINLAYLLNVIGLKVDYEKIKNMNPQELETIKFIVDNKIRTQDNESLITSSTCSKSTASSE